MTQLPDEQLLNLVTQQRADYQPLALELADAEVRRRGLSQTAQGGWPPTTSRQAAAVNSLGRLPQGEDIIAKGCLSVIGLFVTLFLTAGAVGFERWFWPGLFGWLVIPTILAGLFGAVGWLMQKMKPRP